MLAKSEAVILDLLTSHGACYGLQLVDGSKLDVFNSVGDPHKVQIVPSATDLNERALLARVDGHRNVFAAMGEYVDFGHSQATQTAAAGSTPAKPGRTGATASCRA